MPSDDLTIEPSADIVVEPIPGLPEDLPQGEEILWQGRPDTWALAREALNANWILGYFAVLAVWRVLTVIDVLPTSQALSAAVPFVALGVAVCALLVLMAFLQARSTYYTVTSARIAMRIGAALTLNINLPFSEISGAGLDLRKSGTGTIAFQTKTRTKLSYLVLWPHARPWRFARTEPALRCIPDAQSVAALIAEAADARIHQPQVIRAVPSKSVAAE
ncbi:MAG: photosynthetic complex putative assembly protein PuhB [Pseudomonadota bacterium]